MVRRYEEPIEVRARAGELSRAGAVGGAPGVSSSVDPDEEPVPTAFLWRGRLYVVRDILGHWSQRRPWWREALDPREDVDPSGRPADSDVARVVGTLRTAADLEQDVWRVEASPGRLHQAGVYDLAREGPSGAPGSWRLLRVAD